jgi:hypothetical protein
VLRLSLLSTTWALVALKLRLALDIELGTQSCDSGSDPPQFRLVFRLFVLRYISLMSQPAPPEVINLGDLLGGGIDTGLARDP